MFAIQNRRTDFADTRNLSPESVLTVGGLSRLDAIDTRDQLALAGAADSHLLRMVMCVACATFTLALISSLA